MYTVYKINANELDSRFIEALKVMFPDKDIEIALEAARLAPSWANTQCWKIIVVRDRNIKNELAKTLSNNNRAIDAIKSAPVLRVY